MKIAIMTFESYHRKMISIVITLIIITLVIDLAYDKDIKKEQNKIVSINNDILFGLFKSSIENCLNNPNNIHPYEKIEIINLDKNSLIFKIKLSQIYKEFIKKSYKTKFRNIIGVYVYFDIDNDIIVQISNQ